jgi:hypothetical protein
MQFNDYIKYSTSTLLYLLARTKCIMQEPKSVYELLKCKPCFKLIYLAYIKRYYQDLPKQGSLEWHSDRSTRIGGSEMTKLVSNIDAFIKFKQTNSFTGSKQTRWGKLFESTAINYILSKLSGSIGIELGSVPGLVIDDKVLMAYSPDQLIWTNKQTLLDLINQDNNLCKSSSAINALNNDQLLALIEVKCPWSRSPNGMLPNSYQHQANSGLWTFKHLDLQIYAEFLIEITDKLEPIDSGIIAFHGGITKQAKPIQILSKEDYRLAEQLKAFDNGQTTITHCNDIKIFKDSLDHMGNVVWFCWHIKKINIMPLLPEPSYYELYENSIKTYHKLVADLSITK